MNVKIHLAGTAPREFAIQNGETLAALVQRCTGADFPLNRVQSFYVNGDPVANPERHALRAGDMISGAAKVEGGL